MVTLGFNQSVYYVNEDVPSAEVCVDLTGQLQRSVYAEVSFISGTASKMCLTMF